MKKILTLLLAALPLVGYAQYDSEWIQKMKSGMVKLRDYVDGYCFTPTENLVYVHESVVQDTRDPQDKSARLLRDSSTYHLPATRDALLLGLFTITANPDVDYAKDCPELQFTFNSKICNAYRTINEQDFTENLKEAVQMAKFVKADIDYVLLKTTLFKGGEYELVSENNAGTSHSAKLTVFSDPICTVEPLENEESSFTFNSNCFFSVKIGSGYPYKDRLKDYQKGEMVVTVTDAQNELVYSDSFKLNASADSLKVEFFTGNNQKMYLTSPKYTFRLSGPLLEEDLVIVKEVSANYYILENALNEAQVLVDSISNNAQYASLAKYADDLTSAIKGAKPCLKYSVYDQDKIDKAAEKLAKLIKETCDAMAEISSVDAVTVDGTKPTVKRLVDGKVLITTKGHTYNTQGIEIVE